MTTEEKKKLNGGCTQSGYDSRRYNSNDNRPAHTYLSDNRVKVGAKVCYGFSEANKAKNGK